MKNKVTLVLALIGMALTIHIWYQERRGFANGCWGIEALENESDADRGAAVSSCRSAQLAAARRGFGIGLPVWGYAFFLLVATSSLTKGTTLRIRRYAAVMSTVAIAVAFWVSAYLVYFQVVIADAVCPLCVVSAGLVTCLFALQMREAWGKGSRDRSDPSTSNPEFVELIVTLFASVGTLVGALVFLTGFGGQGWGLDPRKFDQMVGTALPEFVDAKYLTMKPGCQFVTSYPSIDVEYWLGTGTPALGKGGGIPVILFLDPNCPHCPKAFQAVKDLAQRPEMQGVSFYVVSRALWERSVLQTQALELTKTTGMYYKMWELQFEHRKKEGLTFADLSQIFELLGSPTTDLKGRLADAGHAVRDLRSRAVRDKVNRTPMIYVDGLLVSTNLELDCLSSLIAGRARARREVIMEGSAANSTFTGNKQQTPNCGVLYE